MSIEYKKCEIVENGIVMCEGLESSIQDYYQKSRSKGLIHTTLTNFKTNKQRVLIVLKSGQHNPKGVIVNYCPFCGVDIRMYSEEE